MNIPDTKPKCPRCDGSGLVLMIRGHEHDALGVAWMEDCPHCGGIGGVSNPNEDPSGQRREPMPPHPSDDEAPF